MNKYLERLDVKHKIRDPLYGYIWLTDDEMGIVDTPLFQRLRRVHQLALTKYVYPSSEHSRFVHSLGAMHAATTMFVGVFSHTKAKSRNERLSEAKQEDLLRKTRFAALLHDIGHLPFSHAAEKAWLGEDISHEDLSRHIISNYAPINSILDEFAPSVASILGNRSKPKERLAHEVISGQLDADRADYLLRDSYHCGVKYGEFDWTRYSGIFWPCGKNSNLALTVDEKDTYVVESFLMARYHYNLQVPYHKTRSGYDIVLKRFLSEHTEYKDFFKTKDGKNITEIDFDLFEDLDDYRLFEHFKKAKRKGCPWAKMLMREDRLRPLVDTTSVARGGVDAEKFKVAVKALRQSDKLTEDEDFFIQDQEVEIAKWLNPPDSSNGLEPLHKATWIDGAEKKLLTACPECGIVRHSRKASIPVYQLFAAPEAKGTVETHFDNIYSDPSTSVSSKDKFNQFMKALETDGTLQDSKHFEVKKSLLKSSQLPDYKHDNDYNNAPPNSGTIWVQGRDGKYTDIKEHSWVFRQLSEEPLMVLRIFVRTEKREQAQSIIRKATREE